MEEEATKDSIVFSNVSVVRDQEGHLTIWCGSEKILGVIASQISQGALTLTIPMNRVRLAEGVPATPVVDRSNVIEFSKFRAVQLAVDNTDGDA